MRDHEGRIVVVHDELIRGGCMTEVGCRGRTSFSGSVDSVNTGCVVAEGEEVCDRGFPVPYRRTSSWAMRKLLSIEPCPSHYVSKIHSVDGAELRLILSKIYFDASH